MKVILTGATGFVGEGVLLTLLERDDIEKVLSVSRRPCEITHPNLEEYIVANFMDLPVNDPKLQGYDACFFCAGKSNFGLSHNEYYHLSYEITMHFAAAIGANPDFVFIYLSGAGTDPDGKQFWQKVKGKTETDIQTMGFNRTFAFRPAIMRWSKGQKHIQTMQYVFIVFYPLFRLMGQGNSMKEIALSQLVLSRDGYHKFAINPKDIVELAKKY